MVNVFQDVTVHTMAKFDDASWHFNGDFPLELPQENGATHIGYYVSWCIYNDLISDFHFEESNQDILGVIKREISGRDFFLKNCDGKLTDEDLTELGNSFTTDYYVAESQFSKLFSHYLSDFSKAVHAYCETFNIDYKSDYHLDDSWEFYDLFAEILDLRFSEWKNFMKLE